MLDLVVKGKEAAEMKIAELREEVSGRWGCEGAIRLIRDDSITCVGCLFDQFQSAHWRTKSIKYE